MHARLYIPGSVDAIALDQLLDHNRSGDVLLDRDRIVVVEADGNKPVGTLVWRPAGFIHEFHCGVGLASRTIASTLAGFAKFDALRPGISHRIRDAVFLVDKDNAPMLRYVRDMGAVEQNGIIFTLRLDAPARKPDEDNG